MTVGNSSYSRNGGRKASGVGFEGLARNVAARWKTLSKSNVEAQAATDKIRYQIELAVWRKYCRDKEAMSNTHGSRQLPTEICSETLQNCTGLMMHTVGQKLHVIDPLRNEIFFQKNVMNSTSPAPMGTGNSGSDEFGPINLESLFQCQRIAPPSEHTDLTSAWPHTCGSSIPTIALHKPDEGDTENSIWLPHVGGNSTNIVPTISLLAADDEFMDFLQQFEKK